MNDTLNTVPDGGEGECSTLPLKWLASELARLRESACLLSEIAAEKKFKYDPMSRAVSFLRLELPRQFADEALVFFPLLKLRARRGDDLNSIIDRLTDGHQRMSITARYLIPRLEALVMAEHPVPASSSTSNDLVDLGARHRSHLAIVGAVLLPIARLRLRPADLKALGQDLAARRKGE